MQFLQAIKRILTLTTCMVLTGCEIQYSTVSAVDATDRKPDKIIGSLQVGTNSLQFYIDFGIDSAVLGFLVINDTNAPWYFPMYCSEIRGIPAVTLDIFESYSNDEIWVQSSWPGYPVLTYYRVGSDRCVTRYGEYVYCGKPIPDSVGGKHGTFPEMDPEKVWKVSTIISRAAITADNQDHVWVHQVFNNADIAEEEYSEIYTNEFSPDDILKQIIVSNNIVLVTNSFLLDIKEGLSAFITSNRNNYYIKDLVSHDSLDGYCLEFGDMWTIGKWTVQGNQNMVTSYYMHGFDVIHVMFKKTEDGYIQTDWDHIQVQF
jgi:hypothetical protein